MPDTIEFTLDNMEEWSRLSVMANYQSKDVIFSGSTIKSDDFHNLIDRIYGMTTKGILEIGKILSDRNMEFSKTRLKSINSYLHNNSVQDITSSISIDNIKSLICDTGYFSKIKTKADENEVEEFKRAFTDRYGRAPRIVNAIADFALEYKLKDEAIHRFSVPLVQGLRRSLPINDTIAVYTMLPANLSTRLAAKPEVTDMVAFELSKSVGKKNDKAKAHMCCAVWIANHINTSPDFLKEVMEHYDIFKDVEVEDMRAETVNNAIASYTVDRVESLISKSVALDEVSKIEDAYKTPNFKFSECQCLLKKDEAISGRLKAYIMDATDSRQVMLGYDTDCCQHLGEAGETSMLHGLLNPRAGFWVIEDVASGQIKAQAECWEYDEDTLVFDNIEFANDAEIDQYKDVIKAYLETSGYRNIAMGCGYNELNDGTFRMAPNFVPPVTAREIYVMSYEEDAELPDFEYRNAPNKVQTDTENEIMNLPSEEVARQYLEEGRINYYDYLYSDVDDHKGIAWLKENGVVEEYFTGISRDHFESPLLLYYNAIKGIEPDLTNEEEIER